MLIKPVSKKQHPILLLLLPLLLFIVTGCGGAAPEASKARSRAVINSGNIVPADQIRVAEYLRYYEQHFPEPETGVVGLDLRLGNEQVPQAGGLIWLQMGLQGKSAEEDIVAPLNLALVIDRSGSMDTQDKMPFVKQSLQVFLESLNSDDIVSIITYSNNAEVLLPAQPVGDGRWIQNTIARIQPGGNTNLHAGMMLGFQEVDKNFDIRRNNRVILLTDGIANRGVTDEAQIAADALAYNDQGIFLSTIGLGLDFNDELLSTLAYQGQGGYSFVDSAEEMDRVFRDHVDSLKQRVASEVSLTIIPEPGVQFIGLSGLEGAPPAEGVNVPLPPVGTGSSGVLMAQFKIDNAASVGQQNLAKIILTYFDEFAQRPVTVEQIVTVEIVPEMTDYEPTWDLEVLRNVTIQRTAEGMIEIDHLFQAERYEAAWRIAVDLETQLAEVARLTGDEQMQKDVILMQRYQDTLADAVRKSTGREPSLSEDVPVVESERPYRGRQGTPTPTPSVPTIELK